MFVHRTDQPWLQRSHVPDTWCFENLIYECSNLTASYHAPRWAVQQSFFETQFSTDLIMRPMTLFQKGESRMSEQPAFTRKRDSKSLPRA